MLNESIKYEREIIIFRKTKLNTLERLKLLINQVWSDPIKNQGDSMKNSVVGLLRAVVGQIPVH